MSRRYDSKTTTFSPEGRLFQVEYAIAAIQNAAAAVGVRTKNGIVIAGERKTTTRLLRPPKSSEKLLKIDDHISCAVAGLTSDANVLLETARLRAQQHMYRFDEPIPVEMLVQQLCDYKQHYTQSGGLRPFGVSFLYAGWDLHRGYQLYLSDPSGNYGAWKAAAMGNNSQTATGALKDAYDDDMSFAEAQALAVRVLVKAMDTTSPSAERLEVSTLQRDPKTGVITQQRLSNDAVEALIDSIADEDEEDGEGGAAAGGGSA